MLKLKSIFKAMRPKQWIKNGILFVGLFFDRQFFNPQAFLHVFLGFVCFSLTASAIYFFNDITDVEADRKHPKKRFRPIAAGELSVSSGRLIAAVLLAGSLTGAYLLAMPFGLVLTTYVILNISYSIYLKHIPVLDVLILASFYLIRVFGGVTVIEVERFSPWLYLFTIFLSLYLGIGKRRTELQAVLSGTGGSRKVLSEYTVDFLDQLISIVLTGAIMTYSLYTFFAPNLPENYVMMLTIPFVIYGVFRYLYLVQVKNAGEAPEEILFQDRPLQIDIFLWILVVLVIFYIIPMNGG